MPTPQNAASAWTPVAEPSDPASAWTAVPESSLTPAPTPTLLQRLDSNWHSNTDPRPSDGTFGTVVHNIGGRAAQALVSPLIHPLDALRGVANTVGTMASPYDPNSPVAQRVGEFANEWQKDKPLALENVAGDAIGAGLGAGVGGAASEVATPLLRRLGKVLQKAAPDVANISMGTMQDAYGGNPGRAVAREGISAYSPSGMLQKIGPSIKAAADENRAFLAAYKGQPIDIGNEVAAPAQQIRAIKTDPTTGAASVPQIAKLNKVSTALTHIPDEFTGQPTTGLRPLNQISPADANTLKSNIYGMADYDSPYKSSLSNDYLKQAAHGIKGKISEAVPDSIDSANRLHDLMSLKDSLASKGPSALPTSKSGLIENVLRKVGTQGAGTTYRAGASIPALSKILPAAGTTGVLRKIGAQ